MVIATATPQEMGGQIRISHQLCIPIYHRTVRFIYTNAKEDTSTQLMAGPALDLPVPMTPLQNLATVGKLIMKMNPRSSKVSSVNCVKSFIVRGGCQAQGTF